MINNVSLTGHIANDLDLKYTQSGIAVLSFRIAVDRKYKNAQGERETDFISCVAWRKTAETMAQYLGKGSLIGVEGSIQTRNYDNAQGQKVYVTEVVVSDFTFLETKAENQKNMNQYSGNVGYNQNSNQNTNFSRGATDTPFEQNPFMDDLSDMNIGDDDLPF